MIYFESEYLPAVTLMALCQPLYSRYSQDAFSQKIRQPLRCCFDLQKEGCVIRIRAEVKLRCCVSAHVLSCFLPRNVRVVVVGEVIPIEAVRHVCRTVIEPTSLVELIALGRCEPVRVASYRGQPQKSRTNSDTDHCASCTKELPNFPRGSNRRRIAREGKKIVAGKLQYCLKRSHPR